MIKFEFPADRTDIALAIGQALTAIGQGKALINSPAPTTAAEDFKGQAAAEQAVSDALAEELDEYESFVYEFVGEEDVKKRGMMLRKAVGVYENQALNSGDVLLNFEAITGRLLDADLMTFHSAEHVLDNIRAVTAKKPEQSTAGPGADAAQGATGASEAGKSVTAGGGQGPTEGTIATDEGGITSASIAQCKLDEKGVAFNAEFCSKAAVPFYGSGKKKGQWKKRQGVDEGAYDDWYADELFSGKIEDSSEQATETTSDSNVAANTFGNNNQQAAADESAPQDAGQLMKWVSEQQAAGNITQQQVTDAYTTLQLPFDAVMNPAYPVADNCAAIYNHLKGQI